MIFIDTEFSFKQVFYPLENAVADVMVLGHGSACLIDNTTFGYVKFEKECKKVGIKPIYGLRVIVTDKSVKAKNNVGTYDISEEVILIAKNRNGIKELHEIYHKSTVRYNRFKRILPCDLEELQNVIIISNKFKNHINKNEICLYAPKYSHPYSKPVYQCLSGSRGDTIFPQHMLEDEQLLKYYTEDQIIMKNGIRYLVDDFDLEKAEMIKFYKNTDFEGLCWMKFWEKFGQEDRVPNEYSDRLDYEIKMIKSKNFQDYFLVVADMINDAKKTMIVGPGRGSSGGSLVCYVLGITNLDPIKYGLIFERFIDINRNDYPDIDTDYPDTRRADVIAQTKRKYKSVYKLATIARYSPKIILNDFAKEYNIPLYELNELKTTIIERSSGDARAKACLDDTFKGEVGQKFLDAHPYMQVASEIEGHARHYGTHAAGIIVLDDDISKYGAIDETSGIVCLEGKDAEDLGLLKIDCLGLRTLSIIENCFKLSNVPINEVYDIPLDDPDVLNVFNGDDLSDIFQFDGDAVGMVCKRLTVKSFMDLAAITSLGRPGALNSGGTDSYIRINEGEKEPKYYGDLYEKITKDTNGIVVYQEQTMVLLREFGGLSWEDVNIMRRIISKSRGDEFFSKYKEKFIAGAKENGYTEDMALTVWDAIASMGSYAFNKSHAVAYAMITYWCAYCKTYFPLNFLAANLNNAKDDDHALKLLRKYVKNHNIEYVPVDPDISKVEWTIQDGKLIGGLTNIKGIGPSKAKDIIDRRDGKVKKPLTKTMIKMLIDPVTKFDELYPLSVRYAEVYKRYPITKIEDIEPGVTITTIGTLTVKDLRDRNDVQSLIKRGGERVEENTHYLNLVIEDDTGVIKGTIAPFDMDKLKGIHLAETLAIGQAIAIKGTVREGWSTLSIKGVKTLEDF